MRALVCVFLLGCGDSFSGSSPAGLADGAVDAAAADAPSTSWSDHWTMPRGDSAAADVVDELLVDVADPPDAWTESPDVWTADEPAADAGAADACAEPPGPYPPDCTCQGTPDIGCGGNGIGTPGCEYSHTIMNDPPGCLGECWLVWRSGCGLR
jgi:hypothetical protein